MLVILSGVSGAGKDTIKKEIIKRMKNVISLPSFTSREPREGEEEGIQGYSGNYRSGRLWRPWC